MYSKKDAAAFILFFFYTPPPLQYTVSTEPSSAHMPR